jgi:precorrin-3B methylase
MVKAVKVNVLAKMDKLAKAPRMRPGSRLMLEEVKVVRLADLDPVDVDMRCLLIIGSSQTQWYAEESGDRVFTPRRYTSL